LLLRPGDVVLVESPTYSGALDLFRSLEARILGVPMDEQGMQVEKAEEVLRTARPRLIYTIPTFHNPTGTCLSGPRRRQLIALADRYNVPILEDDYVGDLRYDGHAQPALKALDPGGRVIYVSTFSKMLMPGLRVGFLLAAGPVYEQLLLCKRVTDLATSSLMQRALEAYITVGRYQAHLRRACQVYRRRRDAMLAALSRYLPAEARCLPPQGGLFVWLQLPPGLSASELYPLALEEGVAFAPGALFFPGERAQPYLRLTFAMHPPEIIEEGMRRLGRAVERLLAHREKQTAVTPQQKGVVI
jgi:GntR family transcriptional regulator/MocR family aminotransferase